MRLATTECSAEVLFCGHYVLAVCTDETSAYMRRHSTYERFAFGILVNETASVWQFDKNLLQSLNRQGFDLERFRGVVR